MFGFPDLSLCLDCALAFLLQLYLFLFDLYWTPRPVKAFYRKAWGHPWPHHSAIVRATEIGQICEDDELYFDGGVAEQYSYVCLDGLKEIASVLSAPPSFNLQDVIVIRREYEYLRKTLETVPEKSFLLIGHPGIGKTTFLIYLLLYRLERRLPTAVQLGGSSQYIIFDECGVTVHDLHATRYERIAKCWALCDSNDDNLLPCFPLQARAERVILTASLERERWQGWSKHVASTQIVVDLPTVMEIAAILKELQMDTSETLARVGKWGPSIRAVLAVMEDSRDIQLYLAAAHAAARTFISRPSSFGEMPNPNVSDIIFLRPHREGSDQTPFYDTPEHCIPFIPTKYLSQILDDYANALTTQHSLVLFDRLRSHSLARTSVRWLHDQRMHQFMRKGGTSVTLFRGQATMPMQRTTRLLHGTAGGLKSARVTEQFYWMPSVMSLSGVDAVLGDTGHTQNNIFCLQATIAGDHRDPHDGINKVWQSMSADCRVHRQWHFVLVCENHSQARLLVDDFARRLAGFTLGQRRVSVQVWACVIPIR